MKRYLALLLKLGLSALLIAYVLENVEFEKLAFELGKASPLLIIASTLILSLQFIVGTARWQGVLYALGVSMRFATALRLIVISNFFNQILPSSVGGDAVRIYKVHKAGLSLPTSINSVMLERLATILGLFILVVAFQPFFIQHVALTGSEYLFPLLTIAAFLGTGLLMILDRLPEGLNRWRLVRGIALLAKDTRTVFLHPRYSAYVMALSVIGHINIALGVWVLGRAMNLGDQFTLVDCLVLIPPVLLVTTLPISIAGWGVREATMVTALGFIGIAPESALILSVVFGLQTLVIALPGVPVWLKSSDLNAVQPKD